MSSPQNLRNSHKSVWPFYAKEVPALETACMRWFVGIFRINVNMYQELIEALVCLCSNRGISVPPQPAFDFIHLLRVQRDGCKALWNGVVVHVWLQLVKN